jgi:hypothetical protein
LRHARMRSPGPLACRASPHSLRQTSAAASHAGATRLILFQVLEKEAKHDNPC